MAHEIPLAIRLLQVVPSSTHLFATATATD